MNKKRAFGLGTAVAVATAGAVLLIDLRGGSVTDPATARCNTPAMEFGDTEAYVDHKEVAVHFTCMGTTLAGTLAVPRGGHGPHPAAVWVHGAGEAERLTYSGAPLVRELVHAGVAVLSYDKRGVGSSEGECCPGDSGHFNLLAADAVGALQALAAWRGVDDDRLGLIGASQAGWVIPLAAARTDRPVAFTALVDAPVVSYGQEKLYSHLTGDEGGDPSDLSDQAILEQVREAGPSGFDPAPFVRDLRCPSLWLYGGQDRSQPTGADLQVLTRLRAARGGFHTVVFPDAGHGLLDVPASDPDALPTFVRWISRTVEAQG